MSSDNNLLFIIRLLNVDYFLRENLSANLILLFLLPSIPSLPSIAYSLSFFPVTYFLSFFLSNLDTRVISFHLEVYLLSKILFAWLPARCSLSACLLTYLSTWQFCYLHVKLNVCLVWFTYYVFAYLWVSKFVLIILNYPPHVYIAQIPINSFTKWS